MRAWRDKGGTRVMTTMIDIDQLNLMTGGDPDLALEVLTIFRGQADLWRPLLDARVEPGQWADACHTIKGAARAVGADALAKACEKSERRGRAGDVGEIEAAVLLSEVKDQLGQTLEALAHVEYQLAGKQPFRARG